MRTLLQSIDRLDKVEVVMKLTRRRAMERAGNAAFEKLPASGNETDEEKSHGTFSIYCTNSKCRTVGAGAL
jgi:hypothetical protein